MLLPVTSITPDPAQPRKAPRKRRNGATEDLAAMVRMQPLIVRPVPEDAEMPPDTSGQGTSAKPAYMIVVGERVWLAAQRDGVEQVDATVREAITEQEVRELQLSESYHHDRTPPMALGKAFMSYRERYGVTQQELARRTGITPGTIHHYESLIRNLDPELGDHVDRGDLTFKEARSIADIDGHERQREVAEPFLNGRLSSVHVEQIVGRAKACPDKGIEDILREVVTGLEPPQAQPEEEEEPAPAETNGASAENEAQQAEAPAMATGTAVARAQDRPNDIQSVVLEIAGQLDSLPLESIPEYQRMRLVSTLRILDSRVQLALQYLQGGPPGADGAAARRLATAGRR